MADFNDITHHTNYTASPEYLNNFVATPAPHNEITNTRLRLMYIVNIVFALLAVLLAAGEIATVQECKGNCTNGEGTVGQVFFYISILVIVLATISLVGSIYALSTKTAFQKPKNQ
jgi:hypothetical protein